MAILQRLLNYGDSDLRGNTSASAITATRYYKKSSSNSEVLLGGGDSAKIQAVGLFDSRVVYSNDGIYKMDFKYPDHEFKSIFNAFDSYGKLLTDVNNNLLYNANRRHTVTCTGFTQVDADRMFKLDYESQSRIAAGQTATVLIELSNEHCYSYGNIVVSFYYIDIPENVTVEMYTRNHSSEYSWHTIERSLQFHTNKHYYFAYNNTDAQWVFYINDTYVYCTKIRVTITAKSSAAASLSQIAFYGARMTLADSPLITKYLDLDIPYLNITAKSCKIANASSSQFLKGDGSLDSTTYSTSTHTHYIGTTAVQKISATQNLSGIGALSCADITCTSITETSDIRKKTNIHKLDYDTYKLIDDISPCRFMYKDDTSESYRIGLIAQDVENIFPEVVHTDKDGFKSIEYSKLGVLAIDMIKRLKQEILKLDDRIKYLENKNG